MKTFELELSWMMTTNIFVEAQSAEEAEQYATTMGQPEAGNFVPFSTGVGSIEEVDTSVNRSRSGLFRVK